MRLLQCLVADQVNRKIGDKTGTLKIEAIELKVINDCLSKRLSRSDLGNIYLQCRLCDFTFATFINPDDATETFQQYRHFRFLLFLMNPSMQERKSSVTSCRSQWEAVLWFRSLILGQNAMCVELV